MDRRALVLKSISCRGVKSFNLFQKPSTYAVVSIAAAGTDDRRKRKQLKQKTAADHESRENPEWNQTIQFDLDEIDFQNLFLEFAIMAQGNLLLFGDKLIGKSRVPMIDLFVGHSSDVVRHVSYQVRTPEGKPNGVLSFSYSFNIPMMEIRIPPAIPSAPPMDDYNPPPASPRNSLYPPLQLPEAEQEDCFHYCNQPPPPEYYAQLPAKAEPENCFYHCNQPPPLDPPKYYPPPPPPLDPPKYYPPPPPPPAAGHYPAFDLAVYFSTPAVAHGGFYSPPAAPLQPPMPAFGTYYPPSAPAYLYPPPSQWC